MREYKDPTVEVIELPEEDVITTSGETTPASSTNSNTEMPQAPFFAPYRGGNGANRQ